jgi:glycosyltransferase involved in cell wall biosynthesis
MSVLDVEIVTTAHWGGDPRLNRHIQYLTAGGVRAALSTFAESSRIIAVVKALRAILASEARVVILPDPEMFLIGSLVARLRRRMPVIDIHEDYGKAAMARSWVPDLARRFVRAVADMAVSAGRSAAWRVLVAAPELAREGDFMALNIPDPSTFEPAAHDGSNRLAYVGDITTARGALAMVELLADLDETFVLRLIGRASEGTSEELHAAALRMGVADRVELTGRLEHNRAWAEAKGSLAGLNLLEPAPAYREAVATKLWEYLAIGLPPIVSDLPGQRGLIGSIDEDLVCSSTRQAAAIATALSADPERRAALAEKGRRLVEKAWSDNRPDRAVQAVVEP